MHRTLADRAGPRVRRLLRSLLVVPLVAVAAAAPLAAQLQPGHTTPQPVVESTGASGPGGQVVIQPPGAGGVAGHSTIEIVFSVSVLAWGLVLIGGLTWVMVRSGQYWNGVYLRLCVLAIVVTSGLFVVVAGYTENQIAPMMGLLGTLVGYLLGRGTDATPKPPEPKE